MLVVKGRTRLLLLLLLLRLVDFNADDDEDGT